MDPERKVIAGKNTVRSKMRQDDTRIQLDRGFQFRYLCPFSPVSQQVGPSPPPQFSSLQLS
jgi:hypothetical protein